MKEEPVGRWVPAQADREAGGSMLEGGDTRTVSSGARSSRETLRAVRAALDEFVRRRASGEAVSRAEFEREHSDLMPTLGAELDLLKVMDAASRRAIEGWGSSTPTGGERAYERSFGAPARIAGYTIRREIHRGAQGVVYLAVEDATQREAAVKVLHPGLFGRAGDSARFEREVGILRRLRHPGIVAVRDSGLAEGCHYFAMDYVEGEPLDRALLGTARPLREKLEMFVEIAEAVAAAHVRGVIHRDLKPANIRVDLASRPHVLDFGLAKLVEGSQGLSMTADGQFVGSLPWASPEQVGGGGEVDVRSDVYALGVILHQMLTASFPYPVVGPVREVVRTIVEVEPTPASRANRELDDEIDTIILRCLSKSPTRRYQSAGELAADVRRYLNGEPIDAKRDSSLYVLRKQVVRHRWLVTLAATLALSLVAFAVYASYSAAESRSLAQREAVARVKAEEAGARAIEAQIEASNERDAANEARSSEMAQRQTAEREARRAEALTSFFVRAFGVADPEASETEGVTLLALIERAAAEAGSAFAGDPASEARVRSVLGGAYATFGRLEEARVQLGRAIELHERTLMSGTAAKYETLWNYVSVLEDSNPQDDWRNRWRMVWAAYPELLKSRSPRLAELMREIPAESFAAFEPALHEPPLLKLSVVARETLDDDEQAWMLFADALHLAGSRLGMKYKGDTACQLLGEALEIERRFLAETNRRVVRTVDALVTSEIGRGRFEQAAALAGASRAALAKTLPEAHWLIAVHDANLAVCAAREGRTEGAEAMLLAALGRVEAARGADSPAAVKLATQAANLYGALGREEEERRWRRTVADRLVRSNDTDVIFRIHDASCRAQLPLADALMKLRAAHLSGKRSAAPTVSEVLRMVGETVEEDEPLAALVSEFLYGIAKAESNRTGFSGQTLRLLKESARLAEASPCMLPHKRGTAVWWLAYQHESAGRHAEAEPLARRALNHFRSASYERDRLVALGQSLEGACLGALGRPEEAEPMLIAGLDGTLAAVGPGAVDTFVTFRRLASFYREVGRP
ncbi:MAG: protein kinase domain-containing protein, partial [Phycisphaerales bacterium]